MTTQRKISDYAGYDYKMSFWEDVDRRYEDMSEQRGIRVLLNKIKGRVDRLLDLGCGFGRLYPVYRHKSVDCYLLDYSEDLIRQAQDSLGSKEAIHYVQGDFYSIPFPEKTF